MDDDGIANFSELDVPEGYKLVVTGDFFVADYTGQTNEIKVEKIQKGTIINVVFEDRQGNNLGGGDYLVDEDGDGVANYSCYHSCSIQERRRKEPWRWRLLCR